LSRVFGPIFLAYSFTAPAVKPLTSRRWNKYEVVYEDKATGVTVRPVFVVTGA
jgi:hypothetical protein